VVGNDDFGTPGYGRRRCSAIERHLESLETLEPSRLEQLFSNGVRTSEGLRQYLWAHRSNDLVLQLRKRGISKVLLCGMSANLCLESHLRELLEQGFEVSVVKDATAAAKHPELGDGYATALTNFGFIANAVLTTEEALRTLRAA